MNNNIVSIKEFAKIKGCSTQYVYRLLKTTLQPYVVLVDGQKYLKLEALLVDNETKSSKLETNKVASTKNSSYEEELKRLNKRNEQIIDDLRKQLKDKDEQLNELSNHIAEQSLKIAELFENNQKLQLNYQLLLSDTKEQETEDLNINSDELNNTIVNDNNSSAIYKNAEEQPKKKSFLSRFFK